MRILTLRLSICALLLGACSLASSLTAAPITGGISFSGDYRAVNSGGTVVTNLTQAATVRFGPTGIPYNIGKTVVAQRNGSFLGVPVFAQVTMTSSIPVNPAALPVKPVWSVGGFALDTFFSHAKVGYY